MVKELRKLIKETVPEVEERILWSTPWYYLNKKPFVYIAVNSTHTNFGFAFGAYLHSELLEGSGKNMRHIKLKDHSDFAQKSPQLTTLLLAARDIQNTHD